MNKVKLAIIILVLLGFQFLLVELSFRVFPSEITDKCRNYYRNETYMKEFVYDEPYVPYRCVNITDDYNYTKCLLEKPDDYFIAKNCGWMKGDYLTILLRVMITTMFSFIIFRIFYMKGGPKNETNNF